MTEELISKANHLSLAYKTKYSEDGTLKDMLSRPKDFIEGAIEGIINLLRQTAWRDGYIAGAIENGIEWHDLRKNPNDLPRQGVELLVLVDGYTRTAMYSKETNSFTCQEGVIAWMYEPKFEENE